MSHVNWALVHTTKRALVSSEQMLFGITTQYTITGEVNGRDMLILERARISVTEALTQIGIFEQTATGCKWRKPL